MKAESLFSPLDKRKMLSLAELSELTGYPAQTLRRYAERGEIASMRSGRRRKRWFKREVIERWWASMQETNGS